MRKCRKILWRTRGHKRRHNMAHTRCMLDKESLHACTRMHTYMYPGTHTHTHPHTLISNTYCFSTATIIRERAFVLRYTYIACHVTFLCRCYFVCRLIYSLLKLYAVHKVKLPLSRNIF